MSGKKKNVDPDAAHPSQADASPTLAVMVGGPLDGQTIESSRIAPSGRTNIVDGNDGLRYRLVSDEPLTLEFDVSLGAQIGQPGDKNNPPIRVEDEPVSELLKDAERGRELIEVLGEHVAERGYEELEGGPVVVLKRLFAERDELAKAYKVITGDIMQTTQEELDAARATIARLQPR